MQLRIFFLISIGANLLLTSCCSLTSHETHYVYDKSFFKDDESEMRFESNSHAIKTLRNDAAECGYSDYDTFGEDCVIWREEFCGQAFYESKEESGPLDFSVTLDFRLRANFIFSDAYLDENQYGSFQSWDTLFVRGIAYLDVLFIQPVPRWSDSSIHEFYYSKSKGPLKYVLSNGDIWERIN